MTENTSNASRDAAKRLNLNGVAFGRLLHQSKHGDPETRKAARAELERARHADLVDPGSD